MTGQQRAQALLRDKYRTNKRRRLSHCFFYFECFFCCDHANVKMSILDHKRLSSHQFSCEEQSHGLVSWEESCIFCTTLNSMERRWRKGIRGTLLNPVFPLRKSNNRQGQCDRCQVYDLLLLSCRRQHFCQATVVISQARTFLRRQSSLGDRDCTYSRSRVTSCPALVGDS